jgi:murein L,D-transpeptidase YcbB/YkuD
MASFAIPTLILLAALASAAPQAPASETLRARVEQLHDRQNTIVRGERLRYPDAVAHFYQARNFAAAWEGSAADQLVQAIRQIEQDGLTPADYHLAAIEALRTSPASAPGRDADLQFLLTDAVAALVDEVRFGKVRPVTLDRRWNVDPRSGAPPVETLLATIAASASPSGAIEAMKPSNFIYKGLKQALAAHRTLAARGGWPLVPSGGSLKPGMTDPRVAVIRKRLASTGDAPAGASTDVYDEALLSAVKLFQERHRLQADGAIGKATVDAMNVSVAQRIEQIRVNLERARWVVGDSNDTFVLANLAAFKVYVIRGGRNVWETRTQVGKAGRQTPAFRSEMRYLVFNPDWTVPPTILAQDVLGAMRKGQNAIAKKRLAIFDRQGRPVSPDTIDWTTVTPGTFPYTLRQPPGADNALGRVKFIFPNEHSIFLHDTPSRDLFRPDERTFSSGCIRVEHPLDLAAVLLQGQDDWTGEKIQQVVDEGKTLTVFLKTPIPVLIVYWTVSVGAASQELRYARDVYNLDPAVLRALNAPVVPVVPVRPVRG